MADREEIKSQRKQQANRIITQLKGCCESVFTHHPVDAAYLYGSIARGTPLPESDVDVAILLSEVPSSYKRLQLELSLQADLEDACRLSKVDVRTINDAPIMVQGPIVQEGLLLYERDKAVRVAFEVLTRKKYFDYRPTAERMQEAFLQTLKRQGLSHG